MFCHTVQTRGPERGVKLYIQIKMENSLFSKRTSPKNPTWEGHKSL